MGKSVRRINAESGVLAIGNFSSFSEVWLYVEALRFSIVRVCIAPVCNEDFLVRYSRVTQILGLRCSLITEPGQ